MRAILCEEPGRLVLVERPEPKPRDGEVLVRIRRAGVCGTDFHIFRGKQPFLEYPRVIGHELAGEIVAGTSGQQPERRGSGSPSFPTCPACAAWPAGAARRTAARASGCSACMSTAACATYLAVPEQNVLPVEDLPLDQAAMIEFLAISAHGVRRAAPGDGDRVLVVGAGPIGMAAMIFAKVRGAPGDRARRPCGPARLLP